MKFRMITTFFGAHSFGGDAAYVDRLSQALCRRGHEVHVYYCVDAFNAVRGDHPLRPYTPPPGLHLHPLRAGSGILSPLATQATGFPLFKTAELREALDDPDTDVVHFHNISLVGGPGVLGLGTNRRAVRIMTAHEHWLICPMHLLWKYDRRPCDAPNCVSCCLKGGRPPQVWRSGRRSSGGCAISMPSFFPSRHALEEHRRRGFGEHVPLVHVPYFLPDGWSGGIEDQAPRSPRPTLSRRRGPAGQDEGLSAPDPAHGLPSRGRPAHRGNRAVRAGLAGDGGGPAQRAIRGAAGRTGRWPVSFAMPARSSCRRSFPKRLATWSSRRSRWARRSSSTRGGARFMKPGS